MLWLLNWRVWAAAIICAALAFTHLSAFRMGKRNVRVQWNEAVAAADKEARHLETARQSNLDSVVRLGAAREAGIRADSARAAGNVRGLRDTISALQLASKESSTTADNAVRVLGNSLQSCSEAYVGVAEIADRATSEVKTLRDGWPK